MPTDPSDKSAEILDRVRRDSGGFLDSAAKRAADHFTAKDALDEAAGTEPDPIEVWGRRIGRALSVVLAIVLTWLLGYQLGWW